MQLARSHLTILLNALYETDTSRITVSHPSDAVGDLFEIELSDPEESIVRVIKDKQAYSEVRGGVELEHGTPAFDELPSPQSYLNAFLAGGLLEPPNQSEIDGFLDRYGDSDLSAGHKPVFAGFDTNLLPWRIADILGLEPGQNAVVNGFALATGVRDELDWDYKRSNTRPIEEAFGKEFKQLWNQPAGANREGRLGENYYRHLRDHRYADEIPSDTGDDAIINAYDDLQRGGQKDVLLFSNDRDFVERAHSHKVLTQLVEFPNELPDSLTGSWTEIRDTLYVLTILFGVLTLPKVTLYGIWKGKGGQEWHEERLDLDSRSPKLEPLIERDKKIVKIEV